ncbi:hypothetical protein NRK67_10525 [Fusobacteria bacterium ZRK30]|nr:hypothetical protein NRK67_10525 [Fusobacteria bacterium ZRK30]
MNNKFLISVKGILVYNQKLLLRKNQRNEFELLGGKLEKNDIFFEKRLIEEFQEESGINIEVHSSREPWLYTIDNKNIIILPFVCSAKTIPTYLFDSDGGELCWVSIEDIEELNMPYGYYDSIENNIPRKSCSPFEGKYFKNIPNYVDNYYEVLVKIRDRKGNIIFSKPLENFTTPRELIEKDLKSIKIRSEICTLENSKLHINYTLNDSGSDLK